MNIYNPPTPPKFPERNFQQIIDHDISISNGLSLDEFLIMMPSETKGVTFEVSYKTGYYDEVETICKLKWKEKKQVILDDVKYAKLMEKYDRELKKYEVDIVKFNEYVEKQKIKAKK